MSELVFELLNHWLVQFVIVGVVIGAPAFYLSRRYIENKFDYIMETYKGKKDPLVGESTLASQLKAGIENTETVYGALNKDITETKKLMNETNDPNTKKALESKLKGLDLKMKALTFVMQNKPIFEYGKDVIVPLAVDAENFIKTSVKGVFKGFKFG